MTPFIKLFDPARYVACELDLSVEPGPREYWVGLFVRHFETILSVGVESAVAHGEAAESARRRADAARRQMRERFDAFVADPRSQGRVTIITLDRWRETALRGNGFEDCFGDVKDRENQRMLPLLPIVCRKLDAIDDPREQLLTVVQGVFAGNIYDLGSEATTQVFLEASPDFFAVHARLTARPWLIDHFDALSERLLNRPPHRKAVFFIDNAGSDFLLGALPMIRWLSARGTRVVVAANERPALNDQTIGDVRRGWGRILETEPTLAGLGIEAVSTGTGEPLIDLSGVSDELNAAAADADLVILEGMGRGVESNLDVRMTCDVANLALIKDRAVADRIGGKLFDVVCRFQPVPRES